MIIKCQQCSKYFDDEFRNTTCPHEAFLANNGQNQFKIYEEAWLADREPVGSEIIQYESWLQFNKIKTAPLGEAASYQNWLNEQEIKTNGQ